MTKNSILTFDRALLVGIFSLGAWYGVQTFRGDTIDTRMRGVELIQQKRGPELERMRIEDATIKTQLTFISLELARLSLAIDRLITNQERH